MYVCIINELDMRKFYVQHLKCTIQHYCLLHKFSLWPSHQQREISFFKNLAAILHILCWKWDWFGRYIEFLYFIQFWCIFFFNWLKWNESFRLTRFPLTLMVSEINFTERGQVSNSKMFTFIFIKHKILNWDKCLK